MKTILSLLIAGFVAAVLSPSAFAQNYNSQEAYNNYQKWAATSPQAASQLQQNPRLANDPNWLSQHKGFSDWARSHPGVQDELRDHPERFRSGNPNYPNYRGGNNYAEAGDNDHDGDHDHDHDHGHGHHHGWGHRHHHHGDQDADHDHGSDEGDHHGDHHGDDKGDHDHGSGHQDHDNH